jgi:hypothetical protein
MPRSKAQFVAAFALAAPIALFAQHAYQSQGTGAAGKKATAPAAPKKAGEAAPAKKAAEPAKAKSTMTEAQKIASAESAAPAAISTHATIMDWAETAGGPMKQIRAGTNGWMCMPSTSGGIGPGDPMCLDKQWQTWAEAYMSKGPVNVTADGIAYMLKGDKGASNTDPFAMTKTATNDWVVSPAHVMVLFADTKMLDAFPTDPKGGGPFVMWKGTPYAHLMVPVSPTRVPTVK